MTARYVAAGCVFDRSGNTLIAAEVDHHKSAKAQDCKQAADLQQPEHHKAVFAGHWIVLEDAGGEHEPVHQRSDLVLGRLNQSQPNILYVVLHAEEVLRDLALRGQQDYPRRVSEALLLQILGIVVADRIRQLVNLIVRADQKVPVGSQARTASEIEISLLFAGDTRNGSNGLMLTVTTLKSLPGSS